MINWQKISLRDLAGYISEQLSKENIDLVLVGGACATIYSDNSYQSYDLDFITYHEMKAVKAALQKLGFVKKEKYFQHKNCPWFIEFVSPPIVIGDEPIYKFNMLKTPLGTIKLLHAVDSVKDRLASFYHWDDKQGLEQAIKICQKQNIDLKKIERWSLQEEHKVKFNIFKERLKKKTD